MNCERAKELFSDYAEGSLEHAPAAAVRGHMDQCPACRREFDLFRQAWSALGTLPDIDPPTSFRHDVVMRIARMQHERSRGRQSIFSAGPESFLGRLRPVRAIAAACAGIALALILYTVPEPAHEYIASIFNPGARTDEYVRSSSSGDVIEASSLSQLNSSRKREWQARKLRRNALWVAIKPSEGTDGRAIYRVTLSINQQALLPGEITARIGARVYLLPPDQFTPEAANAVGAAWEGNILKDSPVLVPVIVDQSQGRAGTMNILVTWRFRERDFAHIMFIPSQRRPSRNMFEFSVAQGRFAVPSGDLYLTLQAISQNYGVPIIANAYLDKDPAVTDFGQGGLDQALRNALEPIRLDWMFADSAVYVDREYNINSAD